MRKRSNRDDVTARYNSGELDDQQDSLEANERFGNRSKKAQQQKMLRTALMRAEEAASEADVDTLPIGEVVQVFSLFSEVEHEGKTTLCVVRKTMQKVAETSIVVGDRVRFRDIGIVDEVGKPEGVIEQMLPRETILTRSDSRRGQQPIVANAQQMLIVASIVNPIVKWGLVDRMIIAAQSGKLQPIVCLNKIDLAPQAGAERSGAPDETVDYHSVLSHYQSLGITTLTTSVETQEGLDQLRDVLRNHTTVLSGHSGVGKSSLIRAIQPQLDLRIGEVSEFTAKGRHTTTSARRYILDFGGAVIDTPGVKVFGLWNVTRENLTEYFPDVQAGTAPQWRTESFQRISDSLAPTS